MSYRLQLNTITLKVESPGVYTSEGVPISVIGIAQVQFQYLLLSFISRLQCTGIQMWKFNFFKVKIQGQNKEMLRTACELFLGKTEDEIRHVALETLEGHQRAIMGGMTVEVIAILKKDLRFKNVFLTILLWTAGDIPRP